jgi:hypothetical protein
VGDVNSKSNLGRVGEGREGADAGGEAGDGGTIPPVLVNREGGYDSSCGRIRVGVGAGRACVRVLVPRLFGLVGEGVPTHQLESIHTYNIHIEQ